MPRAAEPEVRLVPLAEVLERLGGISEDVYRDHWQGVFTDRRANGATGGRGSPRVVLSDELDVAVLEGPDAVLTYRKLKGRLAGAA